MSKKKTTKTKRRYNHAYFFGFEVVSCKRSGWDVTGAMLRAACQERLNRLSDEDILEACDTPSDTFEMDDEEG